MWARHDRDSARLNFINTKLELALHGVNRSVLQPVATTILDPESLQTPLTSGASQGSGEYFSRVGVGSPATKYYMVVDTGSDISWLQYQPCTDCYQQSDPIFDPSGSSSYRSISCGSAQCSALEVSACQTDSCLYQVSYGDGSFTVGDRDSTGSSSTLEFNSTTPGASVTAPLLRHSDLAVVIPNHTDPSMSA